MLVKYKGPTGAVHNEKHGFLEEGKAYEFTAEECKLLCEGRYKDLFEKKGTKTKSKPTEDMKPKPKPSVSSSDAAEKPKKVTIKKKSK